MADHPKLLEFSARLEALFNEVDEIMEDRWVGSFSMHPNRPKRGTTSNPEMDGLFELAPDFTVGLGSQKGRGYLVSCRVATLDRVPLERLEVFMTEAAALISKLLPTHFPERHLEVSRDGKRYKITGDFSLGDV
ncbi:MAG: hypothetical protein LBK00_05250 [Treponema sp.]|jgi:hypothetical protein|nr:hypothetical protein [Treponema sp.]